MDDLRPSLAFRARWVFPVDGPPIPEGVVVLDGPRIAYAGPDQKGISPFDLGNVAILPGLVNAHTHLEFSDLRAPLGRPGMPLPEWIVAVVTARHAASGGVPLELVRARRAMTIRNGLAESRAAGVTALGEIASDAWPEPLEPVCADVTVFCELIGLSADQVEAQFLAAQEHLALAAGRPPWRFGLSPHAPYTVHPDLLRRAVYLARDANVPLAMHLAESMEELELLSSASGPFVQLLQDLDAWSPDAIPRGIRPLDYLETLAPAPRVLVIHGNYLAEDEFRFLGRHAENMSVVFCPRTHAYFAPGPYPLAQLLAAGANVALGTDSRASSPDLSLLAEMRWVAHHHPDVEPAEILRLGTIAGAKALGLEALTGSLTAGKRADLAFVALPEADFADPYEALWSADMPVVGTVCSGLIVHGPRGQ
jgi:aminodeoxyfutalosine deaminase